VNFFEGRFDTANGTEDHDGDDYVDAVVRHALHVLGEADDETVHFDVRMVGLFLEELLLEVKRLTSTAVSWLLGG
jgi:hypothetical protein